MESERDLWGGWQTLKASMEPHSFFVSNKSKWDGVIFPFLWPPRAMIEPNKSPCSLSYIPGLQLHSSSTTATRQMSIWDSIVSLDAPRFVLESGWQNAFKPRNIYLKEKRKCLSPHCYSGQFSHLKTDVKLLSTCTNSITRYQVKLPDSVTPGSAPHKLKHSGEQALQIAWAAKKASPCLRILYHSNRRRN